MHKFPGGYDGQRPNGVILGPDGALYGTAAGGIDDPQNCNSYQGYCGLVYKLTPPADCPDGSCLWNATVIYRFIGGKNGFLGDPAPNISFNQDGNIFGTASGGANGAGVVYELSPSNGGWSEKVLYNFPNGEFGWGPSSLLVGHDGNLYGTGSQYVFQLSPSAGGWSFKLIHALGNVGIDYLVPQGLVQDAAGAISMELPTFGTTSEFSAMTGGVRPSNTNCRLPHREASGSTSSSNLWRRIPSGTTTRSTAWLLTRPVPRTSPPRLWFTISAPTVQSAIGM